MDAKGWESNWDRDEALEIAEEKRNGYQPTTLEQWERKITYAIFVDGEVSMGQVCVWLREMWKDAQQPMAVHGTMSGRFSSTESPILSPETAQEIISAMLRGENP